LAKSHLSQIPIRFFPILSGFIRLLIGGELDHFKKS